MKLLLDQNLSPRLAKALHQNFPGTLHVRDLDLQSADDRLIWEMAGKDGFTILTKDDDFHHLSFVLGAPPKVVGLRLGNCTTNQVREVLEQNLDELRRFDEDSASAFLSLP